jgi:hypothetical protein
MRNRSVTTTVLVLGLAIAHLVGSEVGTAADDDPPLTLLPVPKIRLTDALVATEDEIKEIRRLISSLAEIDSPDFGLSATITGDSFAPIPSSGRFSGGLITSHRLKQNESIKKLVELGPKSLPLLLDSLADGRPTKLKVESSDFSTWLGHEMYFNPMNKAEVAALKNANFGQEDDIGTPYTVKVGDICFVVIGQITNRGYSAVRYQPTACLVINSPVEDRKLAGEVRAIWSDTPDAKKLLDSLLIDFHTRGRERSEQFQVGAAMRLAYYFPKESSQIIADRLKGLDVTTTDFQEQWANNRVRATDLIEVVRWSSDERISAAVAELSKRGR